MVESFEIKLTNSSLLSVPVQRRSSPVTVSLLSIVSSTCPLPPPSLLPSSPSPCRDCDGPKVSLKAELFNSVLCHVGPVQCVLRKEEETTKQSSVRWSKVHDAGGLRTVCYCADVKGEY